MSRNKDKLVFSPQEKNSLNRECPSLFKGYFTKKS